MARMIVDPVDRGDEQLPPGMRHAFWHSPDDPREFRAAPVDLPWVDRDATFVNREHMLEAFADEVCCLLEVPRSHEGYTMCIAKLEQLTGREL